MEQEAEAGVVQLPVEMLVQAYAIAKERARLMKIDQVAQSTGVDILTPIGAAYEESITTVKVG